VRLLNKALEITNGLKHAVMMFRKSGFAAAASMEEHSAGHARKETSTEKLGRVGSAVVALVAKLVGETVGVAVVDKLVGETVGSSVEATGLVLGYELSVGESVG